MPAFTSWRRTTMCIAALLLAAVARGFAGIETQDLGLDEDSVRAALVLNLARFTSWPGPAGDRFSFCVIGDPALFTALEAVSTGKQIGGRPVRVHRLDAEPDGISCHVLYIGRDERHPTDILLRAGQGVLTVGDGPDFVRNGGVVRLFVRESRLRFEINRQAAERANIKISAQLLALSSR